MSLYRYDFETEGQMQWAADCLQWWGRILTGKRGHWCGDYDDLPVDDSCAEAANCTCFSGTGEERTEAERDAIDREHGMGVYYTGPEILF